MLSTKSLYIFPLFVNNIRLSTVLVLITASVISSCVFTPFPPLRCVLNDVEGIRFNIPLSVITTTHFSGGTKATSFSSLVLTSSTCVNSVRLSSPYFLTISAKRFLSSVIKSLSMALRLSIVLSNSAFSFSISNLSNPANLPSRISVIAFACSSLNSYFSINASRAFALLSDALINAITLSISSRAFNKPSTIFNLSLAF